MSDSFKIGGVEFELDPLKVREARALYPHVVALIGPVMAVLAASGGALQDGKAEDEAVSEMFTALAKNIDSLAAASRELPVLQDAFTKVSRVRLASSGNAMVALEPFVEDVFARKHSLLVQWLVRCVMIEFADFLGELSKLAAGPKPKAESQSLSPNGSTGTSGE